MIKFEQSSLIHHIIYLVKRRIYENKFSVHRQRFSSLLTLLEPCVRLNVWENCYMIPAEYIR